MPLDFEAGRAARRTITCVGPSGSTPATMTVAPSPPDGSVRMQSRSGACCSRAMRVSVSCTSQPSDACSEWWSTDAHGRPATSLGPRQSRCCAAGEAWHNTCLTGSTTSVMSPASPATVATASARLLTELHECRGDDGGALLCSCFSADPSVVALEMEAVRRSPPPPAPAPPGTPDAPTLRGVDGALRRAAAAAAAGLEAAPKVLLACVGDRSPKRGAGARRGRRLPVAACSGPSAQSPAELPPGVSGIASG